MNEQIPVVDIGCLECEEPSNLLGIYASVDEAKAAHPDALLRSEIRGGDWYGSSKVVIFDVTGEQ